MSWDPLPPLAEEERKRLEIDIVTHGVRNPLVVAPDGDLIDGYHRRAIAERYNLPYETVVDPEATTVAKKTAIAIRLNANRRHLSPDQKAELRQQAIRTAQALRSEGLSQDEIGVLLGVDRSTVSRWLSGDGDDVRDNRVKLTSEQIQQVEKATGEKSQRQIAADFGISRRRVREIQAAAAERERAARDTRIAKAVEAGVPTNKIAETEGISAADVEQIFLSYLRAQDEKTAKAQARAALKFRDLLESVRTFAESFPAKFVGPEIVRRAETEPEKFSLDDYATALVDAYVYLREIIELSPVLRDALKKRTS